MNRGRFRDLTMVLPVGEGSGEEGRVRSDPQIQQFTGYVLGPRSLLGGPTR